MRLNESDSHLAAAAVQLLERDLADRLEESPEASGFDFHYSDDERRVVDEHDRITELVRKLATGGPHELFDWEAELVRESLMRYRAALANAAPPMPLIADENSQFITSEEQRQLEIERATALLERLESRRKS
ncbi:MAG TPA: hypothetical protein VIL28_14630 [Steroidobacteraceae bacterium]